MKIAYGIDEVRATEKDAACTIARETGDRRELARRRQRARRMRAVQALGIVDPGRSAATSATLRAGVDTERAIHAMRWDVTNPWGTLLEKFSTHPLVARRIDALERSGLAGRPQVFANLRALAGPDEAESATTRARFVEEVLLLAAPWCVGPLTYVLLGASKFALGATLAATGVALFVLQHRRCPSGFSRVAAVASLLERLDAGPVTGVPVEVRGRVTGRGVPGFVLSPDLVVEDDSGFVPLIYRQPIGALATWFALFRARDFLGAEVVARGWYRRGPGPFVELRDVRRVGDTADRSARAWSWAAWFVVAGAAVIAGVVLMALGAAA